MPVPSFDITVTPNQIKNFYFGSIHEINAADNKSCIGNSKGRAISNNGLEMLSSTTYNNNPPSTYVVPAEQPIEQYQYPRMNSNS